MYREEKGVYDGEKFDRILVGIHVVTIIIHIYFLIARREVR